MVRVHEEYIEGASEVDGRWMGLAMPVVCLSVRGALGSGWVVRVQSFPVEGSWRARVFYLRVWQLSGLCTCLYVAVRGIGRAAACSHVHIADSVAMPKPVQ